MSTQTDFELTAVEDAPAYDTPLGITNPPIDELLERARSEERRVGKECKIGRAHV